MIKKDDASKGMHLLCGGKKVSVADVEKAIAEYEPIIQSPAYQHSLRETAQFFGAAASSDNQNTPAGNTVVADLTGRNICFSWHQVLSRSLLWCGSLSNPDIWELPGIASACCHSDTHIVLHPGGDAAMRALNILTLEIGNYYHCAVETDCSQWPGKLALRLLPKCAEGLPTVHFGHYPQEDTAQKSPLAWLVLNRTGDTLLLLSKYGLYTRGYCDDPQQAFDLNSRVWEHSQLRQWLHRSFAREVFTPEEYDQIMHTAVVTDWSLDASQQLDKVFLLSPGQVQRFLPDLRSRLTQPTAYAVSVARQNKVLLQDGNCSWWLLPYGNCPQAVWPDGQIQYHGRNIYHQDFCLRPAIRIHARHVTSVAQAADQAIMRTASIQCPWRPMLEQHFSWEQLLRSSPLWQGNTHWFALDHSTAVYARGKQLCIFGNRKAVFQALEKTMAQQLNAKAILSEEGDTLKINLVQIRQEQVLLHPQKRYYLTKHLAGDQLLRFSLDVETASDSHYLLDAQATSSFLLYCMITWKSKDPVQCLAAFFQNHSHFDFAHLLQSQNIPFQYFHYG